MTDAYSKKAVGSVVGAAVERRQHRRSPGPTRGVLAALAAALPLVLGLLAASPAAARTTIAPNSAWTWYQDARVLAIGGYTYVGSVTSGGSVQVSRFGNTSHSVLRYTVRSQLPAWDDHSAPGMVPTPSGRLVAFYSGHARGGMYYRISGASFGISSWGPEHSLVGSGLTPAAGGADGATYPNPVYLPAEKKYYLFLRWGPRDEPYLTTSKDLKTWTRAVRLFTNPAYTYPGAPRPYMKVAATSWGTIHIAITTTNPNPYVDSDLYHFYVKDGAVRRSDGTFVRSLGAVRTAPLSVKQGTLVRADGGAGSVRLWDISLSSALRPRIAYIRRSHVYGISELVGTRWESADLAESTTTGYQGIALAPDDALTAYLVSTSGQLERWAVDTWPNRWVRRVVSTATQHRAPTTPTAVSPVATVTMRGRYDGFRDFSSWLVLDTREPATGDVVDLSSTARRQALVPEGPEVFGPDDK